MSMQRQHIDLSQPIPDDVTDSAAAELVKVERQLKLDKDLKKNAVPETNTELVGRKEYAKAVMLASMKQRNEIYRENKAPEGGFILRTVVTKDAKLTLTMVKTVYAQMHSGPNAREHAEQFAKELENRMHELRTAGKETLKIVDQLPQDIVMEQAFMSGEAL